VYARPNSWGAVQYAPSARQGHATPPLKKNREERNRSSTKFSGNAGKGGGEGVNFAPKTDPIKSHTRMCFPGLRGPKIPFARYSLRPVARYGNQISTTEIPDSRRQKEFSVKRNQRLDPDQKKNKEEGKIYRASRRNAKGVSDARGTRAVRH